ncbi:MAG TPA: DinB family protein [Vicinamibacterales bacterium]|nr:DinB family protein [Vicinamibacterales bacterium]
MTLREMFLAQLDRESARSKKALEQMPDDKAQWKPHDKSMPFGYLALLVATIPSWVAAQVAQDGLDIAPKDGPKFTVEPMTTRADYIRGLENATAKARAALDGTNDDHLNRNWQLLVGGNVVAEGPRHEMIQDSFNHLAHHRGQMTVYLRLMGATVPALYGPSADDKSFS